MSKSFTVEGKTYVIKHIEKNLYLDMFGFLSQFGDLTARFDTKTAACCIIIEEKDVMTYA